VERLGGKRGKKVVLLDTREELCIYLGGHPYTRRDIEMPTVSLHHAGIHWRELKRLEQLLQDDVRLSSSNWMEDKSNRVLVHKEVPVRCPFLLPCDTHHFVLIKSILLPCDTQRFVLILGVSCCCYRC
jgi:hypothetical protein